jgi:hypothetical protein
MNTLTRKRLLQAAISLTCLVLVFREVEIAGPTEFSGGYITGSLFLLADFGWLLFALGLLVAIRYQRAASVVFFVASVLCFPMFSYIVFPGFFHKIIHAESSIPFESNFFWDMRSLLTMISLATSFYLSLRTLLPRKTSNVER